MARAKRILAGEEVLDEPKEDRELPECAMNVTRVLKGMQEKEAHFCVVILDCCREDFEHSASVHEFYLLLLKERRHFCVRVDVGCALKHVLLAAAPKVGAAGSTRLALVADPPATVVR